MCNSSVAIMGSMPRVHGPARNWIALLGRGEAIADGVQDYCKQLAGALEQHGVELNLVRVDWAGKGWWSALRELRRECKAWRGQWILLQFTALAWSRHGIPLGALAVLAIVRRSGARCAVVTTSRSVPRPSAGSITCAIHSKNGLSAKSMTVQ